MENTGTLKIRTFFTLAQDEHGRETSGKWLNVLTQHNLTLDEANEIFTRVKDLHSRDKHLHAEFVIREHLY